MVMESWGSSGYANKMCNMIANCIWEVGRDVLGGHEG